MRFRKFPWKNFAKIPVPISSALAKIGAQRIVAAQTKTMPVSDIAAGLYRHLGLCVSEDIVTSESEPVLPPAASGKWSTRNREGWERKRRDLPKIIKTYTWETPNFGDASTYGWHTSSRAREVYQVEFDEPRQYSIATEILKISGNDAPAALVKFSVDSLFDKTDPSFEKELLWALNVLQENTGVAGVYASNATRQDYLSTIQLDWEVFPPGTADEIIGLLRKRRGKRATKADEVMEERLKLFSSLKPIAYLSGTAKFAAYIGAQFAEDLVVFENVRYGNALYVLYDDWKEISQRSRIDLLKGTSARFDRFVHSDGWEDRFLDHMKAEIGRRKPRPSRKRAV
jgi:hypothetical protein